MPATLPVLNSPLRDACGLEGHWRLSALYRHQVGEAGSQGQRPLQAPEGRCRLSGFVNHEVNIGWQLKSTLSKLEKMSPRRAGTC